MPPHSTSHIKIYSGEKKKKKKKKKGGSGIEKLKRGKEEKRKTKMGIGIL